MTEYFTGQLEIQRSLKGEQCPGEVPCEEDGFIFRHRQREPEKAIADICGDCHLRLTKPGSQPPHLAEAISQVLRLDRLREGGAQYQFPNALTPLEWAAIDALQMARIEDGRQADMERQRDAEIAAKEAELDRKRGVR